MKPKNTFQKMKTNPQKKHQYRQTQKAQGFHRLYFHRLCLPKFQLVIEIYVALLNDYRIERNLLLHAILL